MTDLTQESLEAAFVEMQRMSAARGEKIARTPTHFIVPRYRFDTDETYQTRVEKARQIVDSLKEGSK